MLLLLLWIPNRQGFSNGFHPSYDNNFFSEKFSQYEADPRHPFQIEFLRPVSLRFSYKAPIAAAAGGKNY